MDHLFTPLTLRGITLKNRIAVSPMCQYSSEDGFANDWHLVHLGSRAVGGAALVMVEATAVEARGRISPGDLGLWKDEQIEGLSRIAQFITSQNAVPAIQIAHAGRKASCQAPWEGDKTISVSEGGWQTVAPSAISFKPGDSLPEALSQAEMKTILNAFVSSAKRALKAGFTVIEIHSAHGYLLHEFLSPLSNCRTDEYGGVFENRIRFLLEITEAVRKVIPDELSLWVRLSATDWSEGGWTLDDSVLLAGRLRQLGVDLIDCSSGGLVPDAKIPVAPGYQVVFAERIKQDTQIRTGAVGLITEAHQADELIRNGQADMVLLARELLREPYWPIQAAAILSATLETPVQYGRAFSRFGKTAIKR